MKFIGLVAGAVVLMIISMTRNVSGLKCYDCLEGADLSKCKQTVCTFSGVVDGTASLLSLLGKRSGGLGLGGGESKSKGLNGDGIGGVDVPLACVKIDAEDETIRLCSFSDGKSACRKSQGREACYCETDLCNGSDGLSGSFFWHLGIVTFATILNFF